METVLHIQGDESSPDTPLILIHAISGLALPYFALGELDRTVYGISAPVFEHGSAAPTPKNLTEVASLYVSIVRREIQPHGPYLLGGWSLGGMIAIEMAKVLAAQGETTSHVIMIDSMNPETFLSFRDEREHRLVAALTYNAISRRMNGPEEPTALMMLDDDSFNRGTTSNSSSADTSRENSDGEISSDEDEDDVLDLFYLRLRQHIYNGLRMLSSYRSAALPGKQHRLPETDVTLVKCKALGHLSPLLEDNRRTFAETISKDKIGRAHV